MQIIMVMRHSIKERPRSSEHPEKKNHISKEGLALAARYAPMVLAGIGTNFPTFVGPEPRNAETAMAMGIKVMNVEKLFDVLPMDEIIPRLPDADLIMERQHCNTVTALLQIPELAHVFESAGKQYRKGILKVAEFSSEHSHVFVIAHGGSLEPAANILVGLDELDWIDFWVKGQRIIHSVVSRHVTVNWQQGS